MRLLFLASRDIANPHPAGGDITMYEVATRLAKEGHEVQYVCSNFEGGAEVEERDGMRIRRLGSLYTASPNLFIHHWKSLDKWTDTVVEEAFGGLRIPYVSALYAHKPRVCFWYQRHTLPFRHQFGPILGRAFSGVERMAARFYGDSIILTPSEESRAALVRMGLPPKNVRVYYPGLPDELLGLSEIRNKREPLILTIGKFRRNKCLHHAILVMGQLMQMKELDGTSLVVAGRREDLHYERFMLKLAKELGVESSIHLEADITEERKAELLSKAKLLLITSPLEGFGRTAIEANLFGVPVVATTGVPKDAVKDGFNGYRVKFGDIASFAQVAARLLTNEAEAQELSRNGMEFARGFRWEGAMEIVRQALRDLSKTELVTSSADT